MNDDVKRPKIAYLTMRRDPDDRRTWRSWSGLVYYMARSLQKHCGDITYHQPALPCWKEDQIERVLRRLSIFLLRKKYTCALFLAHSYAQAASSWLRRQSPDVIVAPDGVMDIAFLQTDIPIVLIGDSTYGQLFDYYPRYNNHLQRSKNEMNTVQALALKKASVVIYTSWWAARSAIEEYGADAAKIRIVPFGANIDEYPGREIVFARKPAERCRLLFLAVEWLRKGGDIAFETLLKLEEMGMPAELVVCGCVPPDTITHEHLKVIPFLDKNDAHQRKELDQLLLSVDFLLLPTRADCTPVVFSEAAAFGLPVIATDTGGVSQVVREGENGFLLPYEARGEAYAAVIARVYQDEQLYGQLVRASRAAFEERLNWDAWGRAVKQILSELLMKNDTSYSTGETSVTIL